MGFGFQKLRRFRRLRDLGTSGFRVPEFLGFQKFTGSAGFRDSGALEVLGLSHLGIWGSGI